MPFGKRQLSENPIAFPQESGRNGLNAVLGKRSSGSFSVAKSTNYKGKVISLLKTFEVLNHSTYIA
jgi:hypothetical protein